jgi:hypothetical protein
MCWCVDVMIWCVDVLIFWCVDELMCWSVMCWWLRWCVDVMMCCGCVDVRIGEVRVWGGEKTQTQEKNIFREKNTQKKDKCLSTGFTHLNGKTQWFQRNLRLCRLLSKWCNVWTADTAHFYEVGDEGVWWVRGEREVKSEVERRGFGLGEGRGVLTMCWWLCYVFMCCVDALKCWCVDCLMCQSGDMSVCVWCVVMSMCPKKNTKRKTAVVSLVRKKSTKSKKLFSSRETCWLVDMNGAVMIILWRERELVTVRPTHLSTHRHDSRFEPTSTRLRVKRSAN